MKAAEPHGLDRRASSIACFVVTAVLGYAASRLWASIGEADPRALGPSVHIAYYWRFTTALWWGGLAAIGGWRYPAAGAWAARALPFVILGVGVAAFLVP